MKIHLLAVGQKMPSWVEQGYSEYAQRLPAEARLELKEIAPGKRGKNADIRRIVQDEGQRIVGSIPKNSHVVVLDVKGKPWSTEQLSERLDVWMQSGQDITLMVGGPEGFSDECRALVREHWSLFPLTFLHPLLRVLVSYPLYHPRTLFNTPPSHTS